MNYASVLCITKGGRCEKGDVSTSMSKVEALRRLGLGRRLRALNSVVMIRAPADLNWASHEIWLPEITRERQMPTCTSSMGHSELVNITR